MKIFNYFYDGSTNLLTAALDSEYTHTDLKNDDEQEGFYRKTVDIYRIDASIEAAAVASIAQATVKESEWPCEIAVGLGSDVTRKSTPYNTFQNAYAEGNEYAGMLIFNKCFVSEGHNTRHHFTVLIGGDEPIKRVHDSEYFLLGMFARSLWPVAQNMYIKYKVYLTFFYKEVLSR